MYSQRTNGSDVHIQPFTRAYHPALIPVEVEESRARTWLRYLLSGVEFLHKRGVVHNDIKYDLLHEKRPSSHFSQARKYPTLIQQCSRSG